MAHKKPQEAESARCGCGAAAEADAGAGLALRFRAGEEFRSVQELRARVAAHGAAARVHYWVRESRALPARSLPARAARAPRRLHYYSVRYACVYGGHRYKIRATQKITASLRTNCPAHVYLKLNISAKCLRVVSVCDHHNHPITDEIYQLLRQERKLPPEFRKDIIDLMKLGLPKKRIMCYIKDEIGKTVKYKDLLNMAQGIKKSKALTPERTEELLELWKNYDDLHPEVDQDKLTDKNGSSNSQNKQSSSKGKKVSQKTMEEEKNQHGGKRRKPPGTKSQPKKKRKKNMECNGVEAKNAVLLVDGTVAVSVGYKLDVEQAVTESQMDSVVDGEVEIHYEEYNDGNQDSDVMGYLYQTDCEGEPIIITNQDEEIVPLATAEPNNIQYDLVSSDQKQLNDQCESKNFNKDINLGESMPIKEIAQEVDIIDNSNQLIESEVTLKEETWIYDDYFLSDEIVIGEMDNEVSQDSNPSVPKCDNCERIRLNLDGDVERLKSEKAELVKETEVLRRERSILLREISALRGAELQIFDNDGERVSKLRIEELG